MGFNNLSCLLLSSWKNECYKKKKAKGGYYGQYPFLSISIGNVSKKSTIDSCRLVLFMVWSLAPVGSDSAGNAVGSFLELFFDLPNQCVLGYKKF